MPWKFSKTKIVRLGNHPHLNENWWALLDSVWIDAKPATELANARLRRQDREENFSAACAKVTDKKQRKSREKGNLAHRQCDEEKRDSEIR